MWGHAWAYLRREATRYVFKPDLPDYAHAVEGPWAGGWWVAGKELVGYRIRVERCERCHKERERPGPWGPDGPTESGSAWPPENLDGAIGAAWAGVELTEEERDQIYADMRAIAEDQP